MLSPAAGFEKHNGARRLVPLQPTSAKIRSKSQDDDEDAFSPQGSEQEDDELGAHVWAVLTRLVTFRFRLRQCRLKCWRGQYYMTAEPLVLEGMLW